MHVPGPLGLLTLILALTPTLTLSHSSPSPNPNPESNPTPTPSPKRVGLWGYYAAAWAAASEGRLVIVLRRPRVVWSGGRARRRTSWAALLRAVSSRAHLLRVSARRGLRLGSKVGSGWGWGWG